MDDMYSRGIDPSMADPSKCHSHPDVPPQWPPQPKVQAYVQTVCILAALLMLSHVISLAGWPKLVSFLFSDNCVSSILYCVVVLGIIHVCLTQVSLCCFSLQELLLITRIAGQDLRGV